MVNRLRSLQNLLALSAVTLIITVWATVIFLTYQNVQLQKYTKDFLSIQKASTEANPTNTTIIEKPNDWKTYTNADYKFLFEYPDTISFGRQENPFYPNLMIFIEPYEQIIKAEEGSNDTIAHFRIGYDSETFIKDTQLLKADKFGEQIDFPYQKSKRVIKFGKVNAKIFTVLGRFDSCDVVFERFVIFYPNDKTRIILKLTGEGSVIIQENPSYFEHNRWKNCTNPNEDLNNYGKSMFFNDLTSNKTGTNSKFWYNTFDQILSTFKFLD